MRKSAGRVSMRSLGRSSNQPWSRISNETRTSGLLAALATDRKGENHFEKQDGNTARNRFRDAHRRRHDLATASAVRRRHRIRFGGGSASGSGRPLEGNPHRKVAAITGGEQVEGGVDVKPGDGSQSLAPGNLIQVHGNRRESTGDGAPIC